MLNTLSVQSTINIYYDSRIRDIESYEAVLTDLVNGETTRGANVEKLKNYNIYSIRFNDTVRILFTYSQINNQRSIVVLEILENHEYDKSKFLKKNILKKYLERNEIEPESEIFEDICISKEHECFNNKIQFQKVYENKRSYIVLDEEQQNVFSTQTPFLIEGPPGSGKTTLAQSLIKQSLDQGQTVLYVTPCERLARVVRQELSECPEYDEEKVQVLAYHDILKSDLEVDGKSRLKVDGKSTFKDWWNVKKNKSNKFDKAMFAGFDKIQDQVYEEFKIISGFSKDEYTSEKGIGQKQTLLKLSLEDRKWLFSRYKEWIDYLEAKNIPLCDFYVFTENEIKENTYDFIIADESQYLSSIPLMNLLKMAKNTNLVICCDRRQNPHDEKQKNIHFKALITQYNKGKAPQEIYLSSHYRCPKNIMNFALVFNDIRLKMSAKQKSEPKVVESKDAGGEIHWFEPYDNLQTIQAMKDDANVCVVTHADFINEAKDQLCLDQVFTPEEVVGLEYKTIILYKIIDTPKMIEVNQWLGENSKNQFEQANCAAELSACFLAVTRATDCIIMIQNSKNRNLRNLISILMERIEVVNGGKEQPIIMPIMSSVKEWGLRAKQAFEMGKLDDAKTILTQHVKLSELNTKEMMMSWQIGGDMDKASETQMPQERFVPPQVVPTQPNHVPALFSSSRGRPARRQATKISSQPVQSTVSANSQLGIKCPTVAFKMSKPFIKAINRAINNHDFTDLKLGLEFKKGNFKPAYFSFPFEKTGNSALWSLAKAASLGDPEGLLAVLDTYPRAFKAEDFLNCPQTGEFKGINALRMLATGASIGHSDSLLTVLAQYTFKAEHFSVPFEKNGTSILYRLANAAAVGHPRCLMAVLEQHLKEFSAKDFMACAQLGNDKGKRVLWWLAKAVANGHSKSLMAVLEQYPRAFSAKDFADCAQAGPDKGINALWFLAFGAIEGHSEGLLAVLAIYPSAFKAEDFLTCAQTGELKGINALQMLATAAALGHSDSLLAVLAQNIFKAEHFSISFEKTGNNILWGLAYAVALGHPQCLIAVLEQYPSAFKAQDFSDCAQVGEDKGKSVLWWLAKAASLGHPEGLLAVLTQYPSFFKPQDFVACAQAGLDIGTNAMWWLSLAATKGNPDCLSKVLEQYPDTEVKQKNHSSLPSQMNAISTYDGRSDDISDELCAFCVVHGICPRHGFPKLNRAQDTMYSSKDINELDMHSPQLIVTQFQSLRLHNSETLNQVDIEQSNRQEIERLAKM